MDPLILSSAEGAYRRTARASIRRCAATQHERIFERYQFMNHELFFEDALDGSRLPSLPLQAP